MKKSLLSVALCVMTLLIGISPVSAQGQNKEYQETLHKMLLLSGGLATVDTVSYTHLTLDDLKKIVAFYESPVGKKLGAVTPAITMERMTAGQQLGMELVTLIQRELDAHGNK